MDNNPIPSSHKHLNKLTKIKNGNRQNFKSLNIFHINKGNSKFESKLNDIDNILSKHSPDIFHIAEANMGSNYDNYIGRYKGYNVERNLMYNNTGISRNIIMIKDRIPYTRRIDLEDQQTCTIWIDININKSRHLLLMGGYRQWRKPKLLDPTSNSHTTNEQINRLTNILDKWTMACNENKDIICAMDDNIDTNITNTNSHNTNLLQLINDHLDTNNHTRLNTDQAPQTCQENISFELQTELQLLYSSCSFLIILNPFLILSSGKELL